jgi:hypothetical protein
MVDIIITMSEETGKRIVGKTKRKRGKKRKIEKMLSSSHKRPFFENRH